MCPLCGVKWLQKGKHGKSKVTIPLDIPEISLKSEISKLGELIIMVGSTKETTICHRCSQVVEKFHGYNN